ncbi:hypothetical protein KC19_7G112300 [Ceratodon purpureus]|uniref:Uncharacterized protein n=1 Tax=Ceratodon purpureus TaxID=3225 RepID=A0A8T0H8J1_CERPU|nr:hypothetical protein KC19_7G112300 [Ceratodon purpureus]
MRNDSFNSTSRQSLPDEPSSKCSQSVRTPKRINPEPEQRFQSRKLHTQTNPQSLKCGIFTGARKLQKRAKMGILFPKTGSTDDCTQISWRTIELPTNGTRARTMASKKLRREIRK